MFRRILIPVLALAGFVITVATLMRDQETSSPDTAPAYLPTFPDPPFGSWVAGTGIIEANTTNISIGSPVAGVVSSVFVCSGDDVAKGDPLFALDERTQRRLVAVRRAEADVARQSLIAAEFELKLAQELRDSSVSPAVDARRRVFARDVAASTLRLANAKLKAAETDLERLTVRAPMDGRILRLGVHPGQEVVPGVGQTLILFGNVRPFHLRVDVDEAEAWRVRPGTAAIAYLHSNPKIEVPLRFIRIEPSLVPKTSLTGRISERVDSRALQVIYGFEGKDATLFVGQQMDVFIEAEKQP